MKPEIKDLISTDINNLEEYIMLRGSKFCFQLQMIVGPDNGPGQESFNIHICSPSWLEEKLKNDPYENAYRIGRHYLFLYDICYDKLYGILSKIVNGCIGNTWDECAQKLSRIGYWEFEDYLE